MKPFYTLFLSASMVYAATDVLDTTVIQATVESSTQATLEQDKLELAKIPGGTEVIDSERFLTGRASTLADTFSLSPGVVAQSRFGSDEARISIRGSGLQRTFHGRGIKFMMDGIPLNLADGGFDMQATDPLAVSHINIWRGGNALSNGSTTLGGAIDYLSHTGLTAPGYSARIEGGSFGYFRARLAGGISEGPKDLYFSLSHASQDSYRDHASQSVQRLFANFGVRIHEDLETRFYVSAVHTESDLPGSLTKAELKSHPKWADTSALGSVRYDNQRDYDLFRIANKTSYRAGSHEWTLSAAYTYKDLYHPITPFAGVLEQRSDDLVFNVLYANGDDLAGRENRFRAGISYSYGNTDAGVAENVLGKRGGRRSLDDQTASNLEVFLENQHHLSEELTLSTSLAAAYSTRKNNRKYSNPVGSPPFYTPPVAGALTSYDDSYANIAPSLGILYEKNDIQWFASISRSFEPPSFSETVTAGIARDAQTANTVEFGTRGTHSFARWDATFYYSKLKDELLAITDPVTLVSTTANAGDTIHYGVELGTEIDLLGNSWLDENPENRLVFRGAYTYGSFRFDDDAQYGSNRIAGLPPHLVRGELLWENEQGYYAGPTFEWAPVKSYIDHRNTFSADSYALLGFKIGRRVEQGVSWFIEAKNLTNEAYSATHGVIDDAGGVDQRQFLPGDGRSVFAGLEWKF